MEKNINTELAAQGITLEQLLAFATEMRKPALPSEQEQKEIDSKRQERANLAQMKRQEMENAKAIKQSCTHMRKDNTGAVVFVNTGDEHFILCQRCTDVIRPNDPRFQRLWHLCNQGNN